MKIISTYSVMLLTFCLLDLVWLGFVAHRFYFSQLGHLLADQVNWWAAICFYLLFIAGMFVFVVQPTQAAPWPKTIILAFLFGLLTYGTYDLTNQATMRNWPILVTIVDMIWGGSLTVAVCAIGRLVLN
jgi:uncharacterized membrane protein